MINIHSITRSRPPRMDTQLKHRNDEAAKKAMTEKLAQEVEGWKKIQNAKECGRKSTHSTKEDKP